MPIPDLEPLKKILAEESEFKKIFNFFFDHYGENREFLALGKPVQHPVLESTLNGAVTMAMAYNSGQSLVRIGESGARKIHDLFIIKVGENFYHGGGFVDGHFMTMFYFEDIGKGICCVAVDGMSRFSRFTLATPSTDFPQSPENN